MDEILNFLLNKLKIITKWLFFQMMEYPEQKFLIYFLIALIFASGITLAQSIEKDQVSFQFNFVFFIFFITKLCMIQKITFFTHEN